MSETEMFPTVNLRFVEREYTVEVGGGIVKEMKGKVLQQQYVSIDSRFNWPKETEWRDVPLLTE